ncbi:MAG: RluA family pseudouridine synthase [Oscillospiraceae bacterium]|nr:RluA family pseudouridine synthase [Candidatus Ruminococcus equi]
MREIKIEKNDSGQRLDKFLSKKFKTMPKSLMYKYIRTKYIKLNGKKTTPETFLSDGDILTFYIKDEFFNEKKNYDFQKASKELNILYEDENLMLINKKVGVIVHQDSSYGSDALVQRVLRYLYEKGEYNPESENSFTPALVNRIDRNTGGIVIAAKNAVALRTLNEKLKNREIVKTYLCIAKGKMPKKSDIITAFHTKNEKTNTVKIYDKEVENSKEIITEYKVLDTSGDLSLLEVTLHTGRTHQIRAHLSHIGHPLLGDEKYGDKKFNAKYNMKRQALYSYKLTFDFSSPCPLDYINGKTFEVKNVPFAKDFRKLK